MTRSASAPHDGLSFATIRPRELGPDDVPERLDGWFEAHSRGFHQGRVTDELRKHFREHLVADDATVRGVWQDRPVLGSSAIPVATYTSFDKTINVGRGLRPVRMITDVTVSPTRRRQGLLRRLITDDLRDAAERGLPLAALTVSEGSIYGRFGFGLATQVRHLEVETARLAFRGLDDPGQVVLLEPEEAWPTVERIFGEFHARTSGSVERPQFYRALLTGAFDYDGGSDRKLRTAVHLNPAEEPDGYVVYRPGDRKDGRRTVEVRDLVTSNPQAYLRLWRFLGDLDLVNQVTWHNAPVDDPLEWALLDPFAVKVVRVTDLLWVRVLDVVAALSARPWGADGTLVLEVADPLDHAAGRFRLTTAGGHAQVARTDDEPDVLLDADTLGALYLGGVGVDILRAAGRIAGNDDAVGAWAAMADTGPTPYCITDF